MYSKELSAHLIKIIDERELTVEALATAAGLTREYLTKVKNGKHVASLTTLEKLCTALELNPNDLLLNEKSMQQDKSKSKQVNTMYCQKKGDTFTYTPICPACNSMLHSNWQSYCDFCGQRLSWESYIDSKVIYNKPTRKNI